MSLFMRKFGYKMGIHVGLALFSCVAFSFISFPPIVAETVALVHRIGAILFWPAAVYRQYGMFIG